MADETPRLAGTGQPVPDSKAGKLDFKWQTIRMSDDLQR